MNWLKNNWFGLSTGLIVLIFLVMFILILLAPRQDTKRRGFIPCTEAMAETMLSCENKITCVLGAIIDNTWCDLKVISQGAKKWLKGEQSSPWSNYIFTPELPFDENFDAEARTEYFKNNPAAEVEMRQLQQLNEALDNEQDQADVVDPGEQPQ